MADHINKFTVLNQVIYLLIYIKILSPLKQTEFSSIISLD